MQGILRRKSDSKVNSSGRSYDKKLYTFKEMDYYTDWINLKIEVKPAGILPHVSDDESRATISNKYESTKSKQKYSKEKEKKKNKKEKKVIEDD